MWEFWRSSLSRSLNKTASAESPLTVESRVGSGRKWGVVNFKDLNLAIDEDDTPPVEQPQKAIDPTPSLTLRKGPEKTKLIIIMVGLPGRGKTFLCNKLKCYLNWLGHKTRHFNVGSYRRLQKADDEVQDASFFDKNNQAGIEARNRALAAALSDLNDYMESELGQIAIFDATNTTEERRQFLIGKFHGTWQYLFIESICSDSRVLEQNYLFKMMYSPDYKGVDVDKVPTNHTSTSTVHTPHPASQALADFKARISKYEEVYEPIVNRNLHYIKLNNMVTGRGYMDVNRISGYIPGKIVFFLMQVCKAGMSQSRRIWLTRHGESVANVRQEIGGDQDLSFNGEEFAQKLPDALLGRLEMLNAEKLRSERLLAAEMAHIMGEEPKVVNEADMTLPAVSVWTSTLKRTIQTANYLPFPKLRWKALDEIHAGICDGMTYEEIARLYPEEFEARRKDKLKYRYPSGESYMDVIQRLEPVITEIERERESVCIVAHQAVLRIIIGYFTAAPLETIPTLDVPLHTIIELRPRPDGTMEIERIPIPLSTAPRSPAGDHTPELRVDSMTAATSPSRFLDLLDRQTSPSSLSRRRITLA